MRDGFTLLEMLISLGLIAVLALLAMPYFHDFFSKETAQTEVAQLVRTVTLARQQALLANEKMTLCPYQVSFECGKNWSEGLLLLNEAKEVITYLSFAQQATIHLNTFPAGYEYHLSFFADGNTHAQNGSFYYCPKEIKYAKRIVFNQAGRVYVTDDTEEECIIIPRSL